MYDQFTTDKQLETEGVWTDYGQFRVRLARAGRGNMAYRKELQALARKHKRTLETMPLDVQDNLHREVFAKTVVTGWQTKDDKGEWKDKVALPDGTLVPYSTGAVLQVLEAADLLYDDLSEVASSGQAYLKEILEDEAKN